MVRSSESHADAACDEQGSATRRARAALALVVPLLYMSMRSAFSELSSFAEPCFPVVGTNPAALKAQELAPEPGNVQPRRGFSKWLATYVIATRRFF
jgi:hypothetical protein